MDGSLHNRDGMTEPPGHGVSLALLRLLSSLGLLLQVICQKVKWPLAGKSTGLLYYKLFHFISEQTSSLENT